LRFVSEEAATSAPCSAGAGWINEPEKYESTEQAADETKVVAVDT